MSDDERHVDALLAAGQTAGDRDAALREALLDRTRRVVRRHRRARRAARLGALAGCYLAGVATMWALQPAVRPPTAARHEHPPASIARPNAPPDAARAARPTPPPHAEWPVARAPAIVLERWARVAAKHQQAELFRRAGDRYLEQGDAVAAIRCYNLARTAAPNDEHETPAQNSWLLMALKLADQDQSALP